MSKQPLFTNHTRERRCGTFRKPLIALSLFLILLLKDVPVSYAAAPIASFGTALEFDGKDDQVAIEGINIAGQSFTIELWAKPLSTNYNLIITQNEDISFNIVLHFGFWTLSTLPNVFVCGFFIR